MQHEHCSRARAGASENVLNYGWMDGACRGSALLVSLPLSFQTGLIAGLQALRHTKEALVRSSHEGGGEGSGQNEICESIIRVVTYV